MSRFETPEQPLEPWRAHVRLDLINEQILVHRSLKRAMMQRLAGLNPVAYDKEDAIVISFVLPDGDAGGHEFAGEKIKEIRGILPPTEIGEFDIFQGMFPESRE